VPFGTGQDRIHDAPAAVKANRRFRFRLAGAMRDQIPVARKKWQFRILASAAGQRQTKKEKIVVTDFRGAVWDCRATT
jgi:hypothetical protein